MTDDRTTDDPTTDDPTTDDRTTDDPTTGYRTYLGDLERALRSRGLDPARTADVIGEMSDHLAESGERPLEAFGDPDRYAAELLATDDPDQPGPDQPGPDQPGPSCRASTSRRRVMPTGATSSAPFGPRPQTRWRYSRTWAATDGS